MKKLWNAVAVLAALTLAACSSGPTVLTKEEAGKRYLTAVCSSNDSKSDLILAIAELPADQLQPTVKVPTEIKTMAAKATAADKATVDLLTDPAFTWPENVRTAVAAVATSLDEESKAWQSIADAAVWADVISPSTDQDDSTQQVRSGLGLPEGTTGDNGCESVTQG